MNNLDGFIMRARIFGQAENDHPLAKDSMTLAAARWMGFRKQQRAPNLPLSPMIMMDDPDKCWLIRVNRQRALSLAGALLYRL